MSLAGRRAIRLAREELKDVRFVLIHGGFHGAWCWSRTIPELEKLGHEAVAIDIPGHGERADEEATMSGRLDAVLEAVRPGDVRRRSRE
jgi:pimeloyl-ACP methyl ester carboxylesterase